MDRNLDTVYSNLSSPLDSSGFFESQFKNSKQNAMIVMDSAGYILFSNKAFEIHFGYSEKELSGKHTRILFTIEDQNLKKPEMEIASVMEHGSAEDNNYIVHKDGSLVWVMGESVLMKNESGIYISKIIHNIHNQKTMERFLIEANDFVESILTTIKDALIVVDTDLRIAKCNKAFYEMFEIAGSSIEGILLYDLNYAFWNTASMKSTLETLIEDNSFFYTIQQEWRKSANDFRILTITAKTMDYPAELKPRILLVIRDITVEKELEQQKEDLINFVTHELRNPLANMALCAELMQDSIKDNRIEEMEEYLLKTKNNIRRLTNVVHELHDATKAGSGQLKINKQFVLYEQMVDEAIETVSDLHSNYQIIKTGDARVGVYADRNRLIQVMTNYLTNAIKYSTVEKKIVINVSVNGEKLITSVTDYGPGIPAEKLPHIFNRYYRVENSEAIEGLGLGLYLSREIITAHGGEVWVETEANKGSTFFFSLELGKTWDNEATNP